MYSKHENPSIIQAENIGKANVGIIKRDIKSLRIINSENYHASKNRWEYKTKCTLENTRESLFRKSRGAQW